MNEARETARGTWAANVTGGAVKSIWRMRVAGVGGWLTAVFAVSAAPEAVEIISPAWRGAAQPQVAVGARGEVFVAFGKENSVWCAVSRDRGRTFGEPQRVGEVPAKLALGMRRGPRVAVGHGRVAISAISHGDGDLRVWVSDEHASAWSPPATINETGGSAREGMHAMAADRAGMMTLVWLDLRSGSTEPWITVSTDGGITWGLQSRVYRSPAGTICECCHPSVAMGARGEIVAMWRNWLNGSRDLYLATSRDGGRSFGEAVRSGSGTWKLAACPMDGGSVAMDASGRPLAAWRRENAVFLASGREERMLAEGAAHPVVVLSGSTTHVLWQGSGGLVWKRGEEPAVTIDPIGRFVSAAALPESDGVIAVWESRAGDQPTLMGKILGL